MTIVVLVTGSLFKPPESRTSKGGKQFVSGRMDIVQVLASAPYGDKLVIR